MTKPLSNDLRKRLVSAVETGMTRRSAAQRFGVAASTAIKWADQWRRTGDVRPKPRGGDHRSQRIEAHAEEILALIEETPDITLAEMAEHLDEAHGLVVAQSTIWRLLDRRAMTFKKNAHASEQQRPDVVRRPTPGSTPSRTWSRRGWSSSTRPAPRPRWRGAMAGHGAASGAVPRCPMVTGRPPPSSARFGWRA